MKITLKNSLFLVPLLFVLVTNAQTVENSVTNNPEESKKVENLKEKKEAIEEKKIERVKTAADKELDKRIEDLGKVADRIKEFKNLGDTDKATITSQINGLIGSLNSLRAEIETTTSTTSLKQARESIKNNYRIYALAIPQINIVASADRMITLVSMMNIVGAKLESKISTLATSTAITSANIASAKKSLSEMKDKLVEAQKLAQDAVLVVSVLVPDQGDKTVMDSNLAVLKDARTKIKNAQANIAAVKKSAETIVKLLKKDPANRKVSTTTPETN